MPLIQVTIVAGRSVEQKHELIRNLSEATSSTLDVPLDRVRVVIYEVSGDEWGIGGVPFSAARAPQPEPGAR